MLRQFTTKADAITFSFSWKEVRSKKEQSTLYTYLDEVWTVRNSHIVNELPPQYLFVLLPCYKNDCSHQLCRKGKPENDRLWYENGPPLANIPFPIPDHKRPWGSHDCTECKSVCSGHFLSPEDKFGHVAKHGTGDCQFSPPSEVIKCECHKRTRQGQLMDENTILTYAKATLHSKEEVEMWLDHLSCLAKHRQAGAKKDARSRAKKGR